MTLLRLLPASLLAALLLTVSGAAALAAPACGSVRNVVLSDVPTLVLDQRRLSRSFGADAPCIDYLLRIPINWTEETAGGAISLSAVASPYAAVDLPQIALKYPAGIIRHDGGNSYSVTPGKAVPRPRPWTRAEIADCRAALGRYSAEVCDASEAEFAIGIGNPDDIALTRRVPVSAQQLEKARLMGVFLLVAFRVDPDQADARFSAIETVSATLTGLTIVDGAGGTLATGWSSDTLPIRDAKAKHQWARKPSGENVSRAYPDRALRYNISGRVVMTCRVGHFGWLRRCVAISETPPDYVFGDASMRLGRLMRVAPFVEDEDFIGATIRIPLAFTAPDSEAAPLPGPDAAPPPVPISPVPQP